MLENTTNYLQHTIITPSHYHRNFENDLPQTSNSNWADKAKRIALVALPFIAMYKPVGKTLSIGMGTCRVFTHGSAIISSIIKRDAIACAGEIWQTAIAIIAVATGIFYFQKGTHGVERIFNISLTDFIRVESTYLSFL